MVSSSVLLGSDGGNPGNLMNNSLKNEAVPVHVSSALQEVAAHLKHSAKCRMKAALTLAVGLEKKKKKSVVKWSVKCFRAHSKRTLFEPYLLKHVANHGTLKHFRKYVRLHYHQDTEQIRFMKI